MRLDLDMSTAEGRYGMILAIRQTEERIGSLFHEGRTSGTAHLCIGQEACAVGAVAAARPDDPIVSSHRGHGHFLARTADPAALLGELMGKVIGPCMGRGGSQHLCSVHEHFYGTNGITGGGLPIATGLALSQKLQQTERVVLCFFGDGASNQGTFHESLNMASIWRLPVLYFCENNHYAMSMRADCHMNVDSIAARACAYGMESVRIDGMDVEGVRQAVAEALDHIRSDSRPRLIEADCYRFSGHSKSDRFVYRTREEEARWRERDPLPSARRRLIERGMTEKQVQELEARVGRTVERSYQEACDAPAPAQQQVLVPPYAEPTGQ